MATSIKSQNKNVLLVGILLMLIGLAATYLVLANNLRTARAHLATSEAQLTGVETDIDVLTNAQSRLDIAEAAMASQKKVDFDKIPLVYPQTEDITGLYLQLEALMTKASASGISLPAYQVAAPTVDATDKSVHIPVSVSATGTYVALKSFLMDMEDNLRPFAISTVNLTQTLDKDKGTPNGLFTLNVAAVIRAQTLSAAYTSVGSN